MRQMKISSGYILYFIIIFGSIFTDCITGVWFGTIGRCWLGISLPFFLCLFFWWGTKKVQINRFTIIMIAILVWIGISSFIANIQYYSQTGSLMVLQENS